jgi:AcrR family transcriptional regulator
LPKIVNHDEYREKILEKSLSLFTRKGYFNINMRQLAAEIDVSTGTLYNYFPSKKDILAAMIAWIGNKNVDEYIHLTSSVEKIHDRFDIVVDYLKEKGEFHENIMLLAIDHFRNTDIEQWKEVYSVFADVNIGGMSERLNISRQFALSIFIYFIGLSFHSLAFDGTKEYNKQIDFLNTILRPVIVDAPDDMERAAQKFQEITRNVLMNKVLPSKTTSIKKNKKNKAKKVISERKDRNLKTQQLRTH